MIHRFDTHAHYTDERFLSEYDGGADALLEKLFSEGLGGIINVGTNPENSGEAVAMARKYEKMYAAVGIHPSDSESIADMNEALDRICRLLDRGEENKIVALGEIGFDYHYDSTDKPKQREYLYSQADIAEKYNLPVIIHDREAHGDCFDLVCQRKKLRGVFHSYSGSVELARELVRRGWYISFSGVLTFKNAKKTVEVAREIPSEFILTETDCPYLAPQPYRGRLNHSGLLGYTEEALAALRGISPDTLSEILRANIKRLFGI